MDGPPAYDPEVVAGFGALGFRRVGGLLADLTDAEVEDMVGGYAPDVQAELRRSARIPETVLAAPDASAFLGVDWFYGQPSVRLRSLLVDGRLVETQRAWDRMPDHPLALARWVSTRRPSTRRERSRTDGWP